MFKKVLFFITLAILTVSLRPSYAEPDPLNVRRQMNYLLLNPRVRQEMHDFVRTSHMERPAIVSVEFNEIEQKRLHFRFIIEDTNPESNPHRISIDVTVKAYILQDSPVGVMRPRLASWEHLPHSIIPPKHLGFLILSQRLSDILSEINSGYGLRKLMILDVFSGDLLRDADVQIHTDFIHGTRLWIGSPHVNQCASIVEIDFATTNLNEPHTLRIGKTRFRVLDTDKKFDPAPISTAINKLYQGFMRPYDRPHLLEVNPKEHTLFCRAIAAGFLKKMAAGKNIRASDAFFNAAAELRWCNELSEGFMNERFMKGLETLKDPTIGKVARLVSRHFYRLIRKGP